VSWRPVWTLSVRAEAKALVEATTALRKEARQHRDAAAVARAESEASRQRREDDAKPSEKTILQHVALVLADAGLVCARCLAHDDGVTPGDVTQQLQVIAATRTSLTSTAQARGVTSASRSHSRSGTLGTE
jgi:hypothetical protein